MDEQQQTPAWADGDTITRDATGETWTRRDGKWWSDLEDVMAVGEPRTDDHATKTVEWMPHLVTVRRGKGEE